MKISILPLVLAVPITDAFTIAVFGASGLTGAEVTYQALKEGDNVIGLTRNPGKEGVEKRKVGKNPAALILIPELRLFMFA